MVAAGLAEKCCLQLAYAIGVAEPLSIYIDTYGTGVVAPEQIEKAIRDTVSLTPRGIRTRLGLNRPIYRRTAAYGHFGRQPEADGGFPWDRLDLVDGRTPALLCPRRGPGEGKFQPQWLLRPLGHGGTTK